VFLVQSPWYRPVQALNTDGFASVEPISGCQPPSSSWTIVASRLAAEQFTIVAQAADGIEVPVSAVKDKSPVNSDERLLTIMMSRS